MKRIQSNITGFSFSEMALGFWRLANSELKTAQDVLYFTQQAVDLGITTLDHADIYGGFTCEALFGEALKLKPSLREKVELVSKCGITFPSPNRTDFKLHNYNHSTAHILQSVENSLTALHTEYLDVLLIHRPSPLSRPNEIAEAFSKLKASGKVRHFGVSNYMPWQTDLLQSCLDFPLLTNQIELSVLHHEPLTNGILDDIYRRQMIPMIWSPLGGGKLFSAQSEQAIRVREQLAELAPKYNADIGQLAFAWLLKHPAGVVPVIGSTKAKRVVQAAKAARIELEHNDWFRIYTASMGHGIM